MTKRIDTAEVAKIIRKELKVFTGTKFSVRTSRYAGGSSIRVSWTDGPTGGQVKAIVGQFQGATFDGMVDLKSYHTSTFQGEDVRFGNDFLFLERSESVDLFRECQSYVAHRFPEVARFNVAESYGSAYLDGYETIGGLNTHDASRMIREELAKTSAWPLAQVI